MDVDEESILLLAGDLKPAYSAVYTFPLEVLEEMAPGKAAELRAFMEEGSK